MTKTTEYPFLPDYAIPPGETLRDRLTEISLSQTDLAARSGLSTKHINQIIRGAAPITQETALILERVTAIPASLWNAREAGYREALLRSKQRELTAEDEEWLATLPVKALQAAGHLPRLADRGSLFQAILSFFGVADRTAWNRIWIRPAASFKQTKAFRSDSGAVAAWLRIGQLQVRGMQTAEYDPHRFRDALHRIRALTPKADFSEDLVELCAAAGVALAFVPEIGKSRISGATWWASPSRAVIQLSDRYKSDDQFWFAFFHEAGHLLLHSKKETFIDDRNEDDEREQEGNRFATNTLISIDDGSEDDDLERDANKFASNMLISPVDARRLPTLMTQTDVEDFATDIGVSPAVVVGRLHHDGLWDWSKGNKLRKHLEIVENRGSRETGNREN